MTYARSRLWLGISGVGLLVVISTYLLVTGLPLRWLPRDESWTGADGRALLSMWMVWIVVMLPLDLLGGLLLPNRSRPNTIGIGSFLTGWIRGVAFQSVLFIGASVLILAMGRSFGLVGAAGSVLAIAIGLLAFQLPIAKLVGTLPKHSRRQPTTTPFHPTSGSDNRANDNAIIEAALARTSAWGWKPRRVIVMDHHDTGFTGGIVGVPGWESIVVPASSLTELSPEQLAITIARRLEAIQSGGRTRGILIALVWVILGFVVSASLPGAGVTSVAGLAMTCLGFTLWTFLGLLTLPTLSRQASYAIDHRVVGRGADGQEFHAAVRTLDRLQDDEPQRSKWIERIFHPVPSVDNRRTESASGFPIAWHAARMTLFLSWACMGMLVRAVHCNVGRPELWVMLPTD